MTTIAVYELMILLFLLIVLAAGYVIKKNVIKMIEKNDKLESDQVKSGVTIVNVVYYTILIIIVLMILAPFIVRFTNF